MRTSRARPPGEACDQRVPRPRLRHVLAVLFALHAGTAAATAFYVNQQSVKGLGRVDAGNTAAADELSTIFLNPAGLNEFWKAEKGDRAFSFATHLIIPRGTQRNTGSTATTLATGGVPLPYGGGDSRDPTDPTPVPITYYAVRLSDRASVGLGVNAPFGLRAQFDEGWYGRYDAIEASLRTVNLSVVGAYLVTGQLSIGGGLDVQYARTTLTTAIPNPLVPGGPTPATDARAATVGHGYRAGFNAGLLYSTPEGHRVGLHYRSGMNHRIEGTSRITGLPGPLAVFNGEIGARARLRLPAIATLGARYRASDRLVLLGELEWFDWSTFDEVRIQFDDGRADAVRPTRYRDAYGVAVGAEYREPASRWTWRGGLHYDTTPTVDEFRDTTVPDSERLWLGLGATYRMGARFETDFAFNHVFFRRTSIGLTRTFFDGTPVQASVRIDGAVKTVVNTISIGLRWRF